MVYDLNTKKFRKLNRSNINNNHAVGVIFLKKEALNILKEYFLICGYALVNKNFKYIFPIDIREDGVTVLENVYNCFCEALKQQLENFVLYTKPDLIFTRFFIEWQIEGKRDCFSNNGALIQLSKNCIGRKDLIERLIEFDCHLICPEAYQELCDATRKLKKVFNFNVYDKDDYNDSFKYIVDALINDYYIKLGELEIEQIFYGICTICNDKIMEVK